MIVLLIIHFAPYVAEFVVEVLIYVQVPLFPFIVALVLLPHSIAYVAPVGRLDQLQVSVVVNGLAPNVGIALILSQEGVEVGGTVPVHEVLHFPGCPF